MGELRGCKEIGDREKCRRKRGCEDMGIPVEDMATPV